MLCLLLVCVYLDPEIPTIIGMDNFTTSSFYVAWQFGKTNSINNIVLTYCDVTSTMGCRNVSVRNMATSVVLTNLSSATNYSLELYVESNGKPIKSSREWAVTSKSYKHLQKFLFCKIQCYTYKTVVANILSDALAGTSCWQF